ncbi:hypothetical protein MMC07_009417 [Pseudocyphellaria aurata]|nr:hypothetical protein [Pseudocyphellaria aurata]
MATLVVVTTSLPQLRSTHLHHFFQHHANDCRVIASQTHREDLLRGKRDSPPLTSRRPFLACGQIQGPAGQSGTFELPAGTAEPLQLAWFLNHIVTAISAYDRVYIVQAMVGQPDRVAASASLYAGRIHGIRPVPGALYYIAVSAPAQVIMSWLFQLPSNAG